MRLIPDRKGTIMLSKPKFKRWLLPLLLLSAILVCQSAWSASLFSTFFKTFNVVNSTCTSDLDMPEGSVGLITPERQEHILRGNKEIKNNRCGGHSWNFVRRIKENGGKIIYHKRFNNGVRKIVMKYNSNGKNIILKKTLFPRSWSDKDILSTVNKIAFKKLQKDMTNRYNVYGWGKNNVKVKVVIQPTVTASGAVVHCVVTAHPVQ